MQGWPCPKTLSGFLGLISYYRKFVKNYGKVATPLTTLLKMIAFVWSEVVDQTFTTLKDVVCTTSEIVVLDFTKTFVWNVIHEV